MNNKVSTCLYIDRGVLEAAKQAGLNLSRVSENALVAAIGRVSGTDPGTGPAGRPVGAGADGSPGEVRTPVGGSKARHACPLHHRASWFRVG